MIKNYIPHQNLEDPSNIIKNSKNSSFIFNNNLKDINMQIREQDEFIKSVKMDSEFQSKYPEEGVNIMDQNIEGETENIKATIYQQLAITSKQLLHAKNQIDYLTKENISLKNIIANKNKIIAEFEVLSLEYKNKFEKFSQINADLKQKLNSQSPIYLSGMNKNQLNFNDDSVKKNANFDFNFENNQNYEINKDINYNLLNKNKELIDNLNNIKKDLNLIEKDYQIQIKEKDCHIEQLSNELMIIHQEYIELSDIVEELNYLVSHSDYNELKTEFNCLLREKEILLKEKEKNHKEIISLREKLTQNSNDPININ